MKIEILVIADFLFSEVFLHDPGLLIVENVGLEGVCCFPR